MDGCKYCVDRLKGITGECKYIKLFSVITHIEDGRLWTLTKHCPRGAEKVMGLLKKKKTTNYKSALMSLRNCMRYESLAARRLLMKYSNDDDSLVRKAARKVLRSYTERKG